MYAPDAFEENDPKRILHFLQEHNFGTLIQSGDTEPIATHLPFQIQEKNGDVLLLAHLSKNNPHAHLIRDGKTALVTFLGPDGYITSSVYGHPNVPTWNYQSVHIYGIISVATKEEMRHHLKSLVQHHETNSAKPLELEKLPIELIESYLDEIIAFKIHSYRMEGAFKLSQNRNKADFDAILNDLSKDPKNSDLIAAMKAERK